MDETDRNTLAKASGLNGCLVGAAIFGLLLAVLMWAQIRARSAQIGIPALSAA